MENDSSIADLQFWKDWYQTEVGQKLFPSIESLRWFIRTHQQALIDKDALVFFRSRWFLVAPKFEQAVMSLLRESTRMALSGERAA